MKMSIIHVDEEDGSAAVPATFSGSEMSVIFT